MKNSLAQHTLFWVIIATFLTLYFGNENGDYQQSFFFVTFLIPVAIGTTYFFNYYLLPKYLLKERYGKFILYFVYMVIFSLYAEMIVVTISFIVLANYQFDNLNPLTVDVFSLGITLYFIVFIIAIYRLLKSLKESQSKNKEISEQLVKDKLDTLTIVVDRKQVPIALRDLIYIESLADYVKLFTKTESYITREKISHLEKELPSHFVRIHRSFIVNKSQVRSFSREAVEVADLSLPISRTYKKAALAELEE